MNKNIIRTALAISLFAINAGNAATTSDVNALEKEFIAVENQLITPELRLDDLQKERSQYDGFSGWFKGSTKKALDAEIEKNEAEAKKLGDTLTNLNKEIQAKVYDVALSYEKNGNYDKAIEFYMKVTNQNDNVKERIAACFKGKKDFMSAIKWLMLMKRTDSVLLEVADCYYCAGNKKETINWLFEILEPFDGNSSEVEALKLIEARKYSGLKSDYPEFYQRLSNVYLKKALKESSSSTAKANASYKKAVDLLVEDTGKSATEVSLTIVSDYQTNYTTALEILRRQTDAAERNYKDKLHDAEDEIHDARRRLERARGEADRHYQQQLKTAQDNIRKAEERLRTVESNPNATPAEKTSARNKVADARKNLDRLTHDRNKVIMDYMRPYERRMREAIEEKEKIERNKDEIINDYIAPYKKDVAETKRLLALIKDFHKTIQ